MSRKHDGFNMHSFSHTERALDQVVPADVYIQPRANPEALPPAKGSVTVRNDFKPAPAPAVTVAPAGTVAAKKAAKKKSRK